MSKNLYKSRFGPIQVIFFTTAVLFAIRLFYIQVVDTKYISLARSNAIKEQDVYPTRGLIFDRNGKLIVYNQPIYDIMVVPRQTKGADTLKLCSLLNIPPEEFSSRMAKAKKYSYFKASVFAKQVSLEDYTRFQEYLYLFPGFYGQARSIRKYPYPVGAVILGDIGEVSERQINSSNGYYRAGDYVGKNGIEQIYEKELGGIRGKKYVFVDVHNRVQGSFSKGEYDTLAVSGKNLISTLDIDLQIYGEELMKNKKGSIVAIEPSTGQILAMISSPGYDPNLLCGAIRGSNFKQLLKDPLKPLFNRPIMATYPPGSTFKTLVGLIALDLGVQEVNYTVPCNGMYFFSGLALHCSHHHPTATNIQYALNQSCNPYFWQTFRNSIERQTGKTSDSYLKWQRYCNSFGLGNKTGIDLPGEVRGNIPSVKYYNKIYGENRWGTSTIISLGVGQGEILVTPLQLANMYAAVANHGYYYTPHLVKKFINVDKRAEEAFRAEKHLCMVNPETFVAVDEGLRSVVESGTARGSAIPGVAMCGKTGTAQNPHGDDHSIFAGYAPYGNPKIAIAVVVENGGFGATFAGPIASLITEKYLNDTIAAPRLALEKRIKDANLLNKYLSPSNEAEDEKD